MTIIRLSQRPAQPIDPWAALFVAVIHRALLDARRAGTHQGSALHFLNAPTVRELVALLDVEYWPHWTCERARRVPLRGQIKEAR